jgi:hypothetical protein
MTRARVTRSPALAMQDTGSWDRLAGTFAVTISTPVITRVVIKTLKERREGQPALVYAARSKSVTVASASSAE